MVLEWCQTCSSIRDTYFLQTSPRSVLVRMIIIVAQSGACSLLFQQISTRIPMFGKFRVHCPRINECPRSYRATHTPSHFPGATNPPSYQLFPWYTPQKAPDVQGHYTRPIPNLILRFMLWTDALGVVACWL